MSVLRGCEGCRDVFLYERPGPVRIAAKSWGGARPGAGPKPKWCAACRRNRRNRRSRAGRVTSFASGVVYFVGHPSLELPVKIGCCREEALPKRVRQIKALSPVPVELLASRFEPMVFKAERALHEQFAADREHGEWFRPSLALLAVIREAQRVPERTVQLALM